MLILFSKCLLPFSIIVLSLLFCWADDPKCFYLSHTHTGLKAASAATHAQLGRANSNWNRNWNLNPGQQNQMQKQCKHKTKVCSIAASSSSFMLSHILSEFVALTHTQTQVHALQSSVFFACVFVLSFFAHLLNTLCVNCFIYRMERKHLY